MRREYRRMMEQIRLTDEEKKRIMENIENKYAGKGRRPVRRLFLLGIAAALLVMSAGAAATTVKKQARIYFFDTTDEALEAAESAVRASGRKDLAPTCVYMKNIHDYIQPTAMDMEMWMSLFDTVLQKELGGPEDSWNEMFQVQDGDQYITAYAADSILDLDFLWPEDAPHLSFSRLNEHCQAVPGCGIYSVHHDLNHNTTWETLSGSYRGEGDAVFGLELVYHPRELSRDTYMVLSIQTVDEYVTKDGVVVTIQQAPTVSGEHYFQVDVSCGYFTFKMAGIEMSLDEIHEILDSLHLSSLTK